MELVEAPTLRAILDQGPMPEQRALEICLQLALALEAAHQQGVIHRDLKPENVFVADGDRVKLADFGAATMLEDRAPSDTKDGVVLGTPLYMAPEHARGLGTDQRTDIYSLGCVLFEMLTGAAPYAKGSDFEIISSHINAPIPPVRRADGPVSPGRQAIVKRAMAKSPAERFRSARELADSLREGSRRPARWWRRVPFVERVR